MADRGVRVNSIQPGVIDTNFHECLGFDKNSVEYSAIMDQYAKMHPVQRVGQPQEVVDAIAFLASENAAFITGALLPVSKIQSLIQACFHFYIFADYSFQFPLKLG